MFLYLLQNISVLQRYNPLVYEKMKEYASVPEFSVVDGEDGNKTILYKNGGKEIYIHNPNHVREEANQLIEEQKLKIKDDSHIIFWGFGMGYHFEAFQKGYPNHSYTVFEPSLDIFHQLLLSRPISFFRKNNDHFFLYEKEEELLGYTDALAAKLGGRIIVIPLPSYETLYPEKYSEFLEGLKKSFEKKQLNLVTMAKNQMNWIRNSIINFPITFHSPGILSRKKLFENKPAIIAAAGPSLQEELENLRYIKENKLAYIFAVGSANKPLIKAGIYPDAVCSFEPQSVNQKVFEEIVEQNIREIPMIFGSSICHQTLAKYPGEKYHMITTRDVVSQIYIRYPDGSKPFVVDDAYSIAILTYQMLARLGSSPIILAGQNLGFKSGQYYAKGISYDWRDAELNDEEQKGNYLKVKDVEGNLIETDRSLNEMRLLLEEYIAKFSIETINTTRGGAAIKGTIYCEMKELLETRLLNTIDTFGWKTEESEPYSMDYLHTLIDGMEKEMNRFFEYEEELNKAMEKTKSLIEKRKPVGPISAALQKVNNQYKNWSKNGFYQQIVSNLNPLGYEVFSSKMQKAREIDRFHLQKSLMIEAIGQYIEKCFHDAKEIKGILEDTHAKVREKDK